MDVVDVGMRLREEASRVNERRLLVLAGDRDAGYDALNAVVDSLDVAITETTLVGPDERLRCEQVSQARADRLLGETREVIVLDCHDGLDPNALGAVVGAVSGGGLFVLLTPALDDWPTRQDDSRDRLAVAPFDRSEVTGRFRRRLIETLRAHPGIAVVDVTEGTVDADGLTHPAPRVRTADDQTRVPGEAFDGSRTFPETAYESCLTDDQVAIVSAFERFAPDGEDGAGVDSTRPERRALVVKAHRGRGKSSAAGIAAAALAAGGESVVVTAPAFRNCTPVFERTQEVLDVLEEDADREGGCRDGERVDGSSGGVDDHRDAVDESQARLLRTRAGGSIRYVSPNALEETLTRRSVVIVDEAAALSVSVLETTLVADRVAYVTTVHGYEGTGRGFAVRFRRRLADADHTVDEVTATTPIRYAAGDPVECWAFRALLLDARPAVSQLITEATPTATTYERPIAEELVCDELRLRETFGLLVMAHYRTEPADLERLLDAPNLLVRTLEYDGHVVSVALLAREGGLPATTRAKMYEGERIRGNMIPDVLTSQLRDEAAGTSCGLRIVRIATHDAVRGRGLGSTLLESIVCEFGDEVDWLGTGFGATADLLRFWTGNGFGSVHCSTTRNDRSGEYSAIMLRPTSEAGAALCERHATWFPRRLESVLSDACAAMDPDVVRALCRSIPETGSPPLDLTDREWRLVAGAAYGPGLLDVDPGPFRRLVIQYLLDDPDHGDLTAREERLLVLRILQGRPWSAVAKTLEYHSAGQCMRSLGQALCPLVDRYGTSPARDVRERFTE